MARRLLLLLVAAVLVGCSGGGATVDVHDVDGGVAPPPDAVLADVTWPDAAAWIAREAAADRPVVVKLFASWCAPCREEAVVVLDAVDRHPDVTFLGVDHEDVRAKGQAFVDETGLDRIPTLYDPQGETARAAFATGMPSTLFFDRDGRLAEVHVGPLTTEDLDRALADLGA